MGNKMTKEETPAKDPKKSTFQRFLARFQIRPKKNENSPPKLQNVETKIQPPPKPPLRIHAERLQTKHVDNDKSSKPSDWTEVLLQVPESNQNTNKEPEIKMIPKPPPRKHKIKLQELLDSPDNVSRNEISDSFVELRVPIEEPIIVPKKVIEHVCDGTHHHVRNVINGKVIDQIIPVRAQEIKQNKSGDKHASTLSLPSYIDPKKKEEKRNSSPTKSSKKKSSASSLPADKKPKQSHTAAEKIESYMIRCKSFGSIIPHGKNEKLKVPDENSDKESIDSWSGLDDWDLGIIEHDISTNSPQVPIQKKTKKTSNEANRVDKLQICNTPSHANSATNNINSIKPDTKEFDELVSIMDQSKNKSHQSAQDKVPPESVTTLSEKSISPIRESYPFKKSQGVGVFETDAFFTSEFILNERTSHVHDTRQPAPTKLAPLAAFDSDKESENDTNLDSKPSNETDLKSIIWKKEREENVGQLKNDVTKVEKSVPKVIPRRKSSSGHSKLLKYIKDEHKTYEKNNENKATLNHGIESTNVVILKTENVETVKEPEIVPTIKKVDDLWSELIKREDINNVSLLEQESTISDLVESSSDDARSIIERPYK